MTHPSHVLSMIIKKDGSLDHDLLWQIIDHNLDKPTMLSDLLILMYLKGYSEQALAVTEQILLHHPDSAALNFVAGLAYHHNRMSEEAYISFKKAFDLDPSDYTAIIFLRFCFVIGEKHESLGAINLLLSGKNEQDNDYTKANEEIAKNGWAWTCMSLIEEQLDTLHYLPLIRFIFDNPDSWISDKERNYGLITAYRSLEEYPYKTSFAPRAIALLTGIRLLFREEYIEAEKHLRPFIYPQEPEMLRATALPFLPSLYCEGGEVEDLNLLADTQKAFIDLSRKKSGLKGVPESLLDYYKGLFTTLLKTGRWRELYNISEFCLHHYPNDLDFMAANIFARYGLNRIDRKTFRMAEKLYHLDLDNPAHWALYAQLLPDYGTNGEVLAQVTKFVEFYELIPHDARIRILHGFLRACHGTKDFITSRMLHNNYQDDLIAMTIELHGFDSETARIRIQASTAVLNGDLERAREIAAQIVDDSVAMQVINHVAIEMGLIKPAPTPVLVNSSKRLEGKERRRIITEQAEAILAEHFGSKESPRAFASGLEGDELCETLLVREPCLESLTENERKQVIRLGRKWCKAQKKTPGDRERPVEDHSSPRYQESKLLLMGSIHEQVVVLLYALKWLAHFREYEKSSGKPLKLIPQYGNFPLLEKELIIPDICYDGLIVDAKLGRAFENILDTVTRYFIVQWEHLGSPVPIPIIVSRLDPRVTSELERDPSLQIQENGGKVVPAYTLVNWNGLCDQVMGDLDARLGVYSQYRQEKDLLRSIENALVSLEGYIWQNKGTPTDLANLEILLFNCWHKILWCSHHYAQALRNTQQLCAQFPSLRAGDDQRTELRLCEILKQQLERIIAQFRTPGGLREIASVGDQVFSGHFLMRIPIKGRYYTRVDTTFQYAPIPFGEEDLESPLVSPFNLPQEYWKEDEDGQTVVSEKIQRKKGSPRPEDIYKGQAKSETKYLHLVFMAMHRLASGNLNAHFTLSEVFNEFIKYPRAQEILQDEYAGDAKYFRQLVRRTMHGAVGLIHYTQTKPRLYSINADFWRDHAQEEWFDDLS